MRDNKSLSVSDMLLARACMLDPQAETLEAQLAETRAAAKKRITIGKLPNEDRKG